jgi:hypothetical protein
MKNRKRSLLQCVPEVLEVSMIFILKETIGGLIHPEGLYVRKDGMTNPENFTEHRKALMRFSEIVGTMTSAYLITYNKAYSDAVNMHLKAWFIDDSTKMNPNLLFAQAVKGRHTGRGIGIIDAIHFMEVVQSVIVLEEHQQMNVDDLVKIRVLAGICWKDFMRFLLAMNLS